MRLTVRRIFVVQDGFMECFDFFCHFPRKMTFNGIFGILRDVPLWKEAGQREDGANTASAVKQLWQAAGHEPHTGIMILAPAMRHSVGRPATGMGGGI